MRKYTQKELREICRLGMAENITSADTSRFNGRSLEKIGYSRGVYGLNGGLLQDRESGEYFAVIGRSSNLFYFF